MGGFILKRLVSMLFVALLVSIFVFLMMHTLPGDPVRMALGYEAAQEDVNRIREQYHLNDPLASQYFNWIGDLLRGDFGPSLTRNRPVAEMLSESIPRTFTIGIPAIILAVVIGIICGVVSALKRGKWVDQLLTLLTTIGVGTPMFWVGIVGIYIFGVWLKLLPMQGYTSPFVNFGRYIRSAILPVTCLSLGMFATIARQTRSNMLEVINQDYIRTARANGLSEKKVVYKHALKNALIPVVTTIGMQVIGVFGGSVLVEQVFNIPGLGMLLTSAINSRDYWVVQNGVMIITIITVVCNLLTDIVYGLIDPRIRESRGA
jgi:peptide/nickel transport system permease protein